MTTEAGRTGADAVAAARRMNPSVADRSAAIDAAGRLPEDVVATLRTSGVPGMWMPTELRGQRSDAR